MKKIYASFLLSFLVVYASTAQQYRQYFDGADTIPGQTVFIELDTSSSNIWQVSTPMKTIFDSAATYPNAIITDMLNNYPPSNQSSFSIKYGDYAASRLYILAIRWKQKIDFEHGFDGGFIEYSLDTGNTWTNAFDNPYTYNFYGFDTTNVDTVTGQLALTGTDSSWKDIWLCFDGSYLSTQDTLIVRFRLASDTVNAYSHEGWMIDNFMIQPTYFHTVKEKMTDKYMSAYPTNTTGRVYIETEKLMEYHIIEHIHLVNMEGRVVQEWGLSPTKFFIDIGNHPDGQYVLKVKTNKKQETFRILLNK